MAIRVNPKLIDDLARYGAEDVQNCYHCGNCTAVCPHSDDHFVFPRKPMRHMQMGLEKKLESSLEPWLCYYCGQCSEQCPRSAEPGETMMSLRRWLTSRYDFTGISKLFYQSWKAEVIAIIGLASLTGLGFFLWGFLHGDIHVYSGDNAFLDSRHVHIFDWIMAAVLATFLFINTARMWYFTMIRDKSLFIPWWLYLKKVFLLPLHFFTQKRYRQCQDHQKLWALHLLLMISYLSMLVLIMFFLGYMQSGPAIRWEVHAPGYIASFGLIATTIYMLRGRIHKSRIQFQHTHESDWLFLIMLLYVALTGVVQHILHRTGFDLLANLAYVAHMMGVVPMLVLEVPFSKWAHMAYRPLAMFYADIRKEAMLLEARKSIGVTAHVVPATGVNP